MKKILFLFLILSLSGCATQNINRQNNNENFNAGAAVREVKDKVEDTVKAVVSAAEEKVTEVKNPAPADNLPVSPETSRGEPATFDQNIPFSRQAPFGKWDVAFFEDGCEEASLIMAYRYFNNLPLDEKIMEEELRRAEPWELEKFGENLSIDTEKVAIMARDFYNLKAEVSTEVNTDKIKQELAMGNLIILPLTGRDIGNPNFTGEGPLYHMLLVKGYDRDEFITNDPGTRLGKNYKYKYDVLTKNTHDWNGGDIYNGAPMMIIIGKANKKDANGSE